MFYYIIFFFQSLISLKFINDYYTISYIILSIATIRLMSALIITVSICNLELSLKYAAQQFLLNVLPVISIYIIRKYNFLKGSDYLNNYIISQEYIRDNQNIYIQPNKNEKYYDFVEIEDDTDCKKLKKIEGIGRLNNENKKYIRIHNLPERIIHHLTFENVSIFAVEIDKSKINENKIYCLIAVYNNTITLDSLKNGLELGYLYTLTREYITHFPGIPGIIHRLEYEEKVRLLSQFSFISKRGITDNSIKINNFDNDNFDIINDDKFKNKKFWDYCHECGKSSNPYFDGYYWIG